MYAKKYEKRKLKRQKLRKLRDTEAKKYKLVDNENSEYCDRCGINPPFLMKNFQNGRKLCPNCHDDQFNVAI